MSAHTELIVADAVVASVAAWAAARVPGVVRVEPGLRGLVADLTRAGRQLWAGYETAGTDGVRVHSPGSDGLGVRLEIAIGAERAATEVGAAVQRTVIDTVFERLGVTVDTVAVVIIDIEPEAR